VNALDAFGDLHEHVRSHTCAEAAEAVFEPYPAQLPRFFVSEWLEPLGVAV
jgi:hypothetical protein